jgi:hypothetical protein
LTYGYIIGADFTGMEETIDFNNTGFDDDMQEVLTLSNP